MVSTDRFGVLAQNGNVPSVQSGNLRFNGVDDIRGAVAARIAVK